MCVVIAGWQFQKRKRKVVYKIQNSKQVASKQSSNTERFTFKVLCAFFEDGWMAYRGRGNDLFRFLKSIGSVLTFPFDIGVIQVLAVFVG